MTTTKAAVSFPIRWKILISSLILLIPLSITAFFLVGSYRDQMNFAVSELNGSRLIRAVIPILTALSPWAEEGPGGPEEELINAAVETLRQEIEELQTALNILPEVLSKAELDPQLPARLSSAWLLARKAPFEKKSAALAAYGSDLTDFTIFIADSSNLSLDPDLDSYSSMSAAILTLPDTIRRMEVIRAGLERYGRDRSVESLRSLQTEAAFLTRLDLAAVGKAIKTSVWSDPLSYGATTGMPDPSKELAAFSQALSTLSSSLMALGAPQGPPAAAVAAQWSAARESTVAMQAKAQTIMDLQIQKRLDHFSRQLIFILLLSGMTVLAALFVILRITKGISRSLERISRLAGEIAEGRASGPSVKSSESGPSGPSGGFSRRISIDSNDEVGKLGAIFNKLLEMLEDMIKRIDGNAKDISEMVQGLSASSQEISATANEQAAAVKEIVSTIEDANHLSKNISGRVEEVSRIATDTKKNVEEGFGAVQSNIGKMSEINEANTKTISGINFLGDKIKNIWDIVNIINNIADQTRIIAFNAELEASSAGEAGKNFQIVASEIRRLADSTVNSTNEIKTRIQEIERSSDSLLLSSEQGTELIQQGKALSTQMSKLFSDISASADISSSSTQQIALSIRQQVSSFEQIVIAIKQISQGVDNFVMATRATSATTENLRHMAATLNELMKRFEGGESK